MQISNNVIKKNVSGFLFFGLGGVYSTGCVGPNVPVAGDLSNVLGDAFIISPILEP
jgi:hypothetical protein